MKNKYLEFCPFFSWKRKICTFFGSFQFSAQLRQISSLEIRVACRILWDWKLLPLCNNNTGMEKEKKTIDGDGEKMRMEKRKKREEETDARSMNQLGGMSNKILISLVNYLPVISYESCLPFPFLSHPRSIHFPVQFWLCRKKYSLANNTNIREFRNL